MKIDVVITWVDGNDERLNTIRSQYGAEKNTLKRDDVGGRTRYASIGEIRWAVASINRFAPWVNRIYIVTDQQNPQIDGFLAENFPEGHIPVEIVDHRVIFRGYEQYLPTFNSLAIETMLWRIPGLSDHFIEVNDDVMFARPLAPTDFFDEDGQTIFYGKTASTYWTRFTRLFKLRLKGGRRLTFKENMINAAALEGFNPTFLKMSHTPKPISRIAMEECLGQHPERIVRNVQHRFRHLKQFNAEELHYLHLRRQKRLRVVNPAGRLFYLAPKARKNYVENKLKKLRAGHFLFCCFNNMNLATPEELLNVKTWIAERLDIAIEKL